MIRTQRKAHQRIWWVLLPLLLTLVVWAVAHQDAPPAQAPPAALELEAQR